MATHLPSALTAGAAVPAWVASPVGRGALGRSGAATAAARRLCGLRVCTAGDHGLRVLRTGQLMCMIGQPVYTGCCVLAHA